ncbi:histone acetyltransferase [Spiromyces aspiralis]|uniref:Histone acetyltransferase n=1 Tax=Spiromyces aspiralis TaxID=68401 RepID=A0ACC1HCF5_9FUNG|nr:histone acetyltransferase [Spiromyces aspiralis]
MRSGSHIVHKGLDCFRDGKLKSIDPMKIPGIAESGWTPEMDKRYLKPAKSRLSTWQSQVVVELRNHPSAWPFQTPVDGNEVPDYYTVITEPMDLSTLEANVEEDKYQSLEQFVRDTQKIFDNARQYNGDNTRYARCANQLEHFFKEKIREWKSRSSERD